MTLKTTQDRILIKVTSDKPMSLILVIPDSAQKRDDSFQGEVISVGPDYKYDVKKGDRIVFQCNEGSPVKVGDDEYLVLTEDRVLGVINE